MRTLQDNDFQELIQLLSLFICVWAFRKEGDGETSYSVYEHWWAGKQIQMPAENVKMVKESVPTWE